MRKFTQKLACLLLVMLCCVSLQVKAQETITLTSSMEMELEPGSTYAFYDSGGSTGNYSTSESYTATFTCSGSITINFSVLTTESSSSCSSWDYMLIYDGEASTENLIGRAQTGCASATITTGQDYVAQSGTLIIEWHSDSSTPAAGWEATITTEAGSASSCERPTSIAVTEKSATSVSLTWVGGSGTYDVGIKGPGESDYDFEPRNTTATNHTFTGLLPNTSYSFAVKSRCEGEVSESGVRTVSATTALAIPFEENFDASSSLPSTWAKYTGLMTDVLADPTKLVSTSYGNWNFSSSTTGVFKSKHPYINIYGTSRKDWIVTPTIHIEENTRLSFMVALSGSSSSSTTPATNGTDDKFAVLVYSDATGAWTSLRLWDNAGSADVYNNINPAGQEVVIDLSAYAGSNVQIAFYGESTSANADNYLHIDDVVVEHSLACSKPTGLHEVSGKATINSVQIAWDEDADAAAWKVQYKSASDADWNTVTANENPFEITGLAEYTAYTVRVAALCDASDESTLTRYCKEISVKTAAGVPYHEGFNAYSLPSDWKRYEGLYQSVINGGDLTAVSAGWASVSKSSGNNVFDSAYHARLNIAGTDCKNWLVSPTIFVADGYELSFNLALTTADGAAVTDGEQEDDMFAVLVFADDEWNIAGQWNDPFGISATGEKVKLNLSAYAGKGIQIAFYGESTEANGNNNLHISNVSIDLIPACEPALSLSFDNVDVTTASANWTAQVTDGAWAYGYVANPDANFAPAATDYIDTIAAMDLAMTGLTGNTTYAFFVRNICGEEVSEVLIQRFKTKPAPMAMPWTEDFEALSAGIPDLWNNEEGTSDESYRWKQKEETDGNICLQFNSYSNSSGNTNFLATPRIDLSEAAILSFSWKNPAGGAGEVLISDDEGATKKSLLSSGLTGVSEWTTFTINLANYTGKKVIIYFKGTSNYGSGDAYLYLDNVSVTSAPDCIEPGGLDVYEIQAEGALVSWNDDNLDGTGWVYACLPADEEAPEGTAMIPVAVNSLTLTGLTEKTDYVFYLRKVCGESFSEGISASFKTQAKPMAMPFIENFNDLTSGIPEFWNNEEGTMTTASYRWNYTASGYAGAGLVLNSYSATSGQYNVLATPQIILSEPAMLSFMWKNPAGGAGEVFIAATDGQRVSLKNNLTGISEWEKVELNLSDYTGDTVVIFFKGTSNWGSGDAYLYLDDVKVEALPSCLKPLALAPVAESVTTNSVQLDWNPQGSESAWLVQYKKSAAEEWSFCPDSVLAHPFILGGLEPATSYDVRIAAWCDLSDTISDVSEYSAAISFITECEVISTFPYSENFDGLSLSSAYTPTARTLPICWSAINTCTGSDYKYYPTVYYYSSTDYSNSTPNSMRFYSYYSSYASYSTQDQYAILPEMEGISSLRIRLNARAYDIGSSYDASFAIGVMSDPADTSTFVFVDSVKPASKTYAPFEIRFNEYAGAGKYIAIKMAKANATKTYHGFYIDDIVVDSIPSCDEATGLAIDTIGAQMAVLKWNREVNGPWTYAYALASEAEPDDAEFEAVTDTFIQVNGLADNTQYKFYLRHDCGNDVHSPSISIPFQTLQLPATVPYANDFESGCDWQFINGTLTNAWVYGEAAHNGEGTHALYVSNDGGTTNAYTVDAATVVYAVRLFNLETGNYQFSYDWLANGEFWSGSPCDYLRVLLAPASANLTAGTLYSSLSATAVPAGWVALDGTQAHQGSTEWQTRVTSSVAVTEGLYKVVFVWRNDGSSGSQTPAAVDNFSVSKLSCVPPTNLAAELTQGNGSIATLSWIAGESETEWVLEYSANADMSDSISLEVNTLSKDLTGLTAETTYYARVKAVCGEESASDWSDVISFTPTNAVELTINNGTQTSALVPISSTYLYQYSYAGGSKSQFIIPADSLTNIKWGQIKQLTFFSSTASLSFGDATFEVYMAEAPATTFASDAFVNWTSMTKVMNAASLSIVGNKMVVTLDSPYNYDGGDLLIGFKSVASAYVSSSCYWQGITATNAAVASEYEYDYWDDDYVEEPERKNFLPKLAIGYLEGEEPSCLRPTGLIVTYNGGDSAVVNWTSDAESWNIDLNGTLIPVVENPYTIHGLSMATAYAVKVQAVCGEENLSEWTNAQNFVTDLCNAEDQQSIRYELTDSYGDGWGGSTITVVHKATSKEVASLTLSTGSSKSGTLSLCCGEEYSFIWSSGNYAYECGYTIYDIDGEVIFQHAGGSSSNPPTEGSIGDYTMVCPSCFKPTAVAIPDSTITANSAVVHWTPGHSSQTTWQLAYATKASNQPDTLPTFRNVTAIPDTLKNLNPDQTYFVYVRAYCGPNDSSKWADVKSFKTASLCQKPSGLAMESATSSALTISWNTYGQTGFNLRYGTDGTNWTTVSNIETSPYTIEGLNASTSYKVQLQAVCAEEEDNSWTTSLTAKTDYGIPFEEPFNATSVPTDWNMYTGLLSDVQAGGSLTASSYAWSFSTSNGIFNNHAVVNIYGTYQRWLVTPTIQVSGNAQLTFDLALSTYNGTLTPVTAGQQADDKFIVLISTDEGATWSVLRQWDNAGSEDVYDNITCSAEGEQVAINLSAYSGQGIQLAFYGESTVSGGDNNLHVDNVLVDLIPSCLKPTKFNVSEVGAHTAKLAWKAGEDSQDAWQIAIDSVDFKPDTLSPAKLAEILIDVTDTPYVASGLDPETTYYVYVRANCGSEDGVSKWSDKKSFTTTVACPAPTSLEAQLTLGNGSIATLTWNAGEAESWTVQYGTDNTFAEATELPASVASLDLTGLTAEATYYARVKADCGEEDGQSAYSAVITFIPTDKYELTINDGTATDAYVPVYGNYVDAGSRSQFIIPAAQLVELEWDSITSLTFYGSFTNTTRTTWGDAEFDVYVAEIPEATMSALVEWSSMDKVLASAKLALVNDQMVVTFAEPYQYQGGNLMIGIYQTVNGSWANVNWLGVTATGASFGGYSNSVSQRNFLPKMTITYLPGQEPACKDPKHLVKGAVTAHTAAFSWDAVEGQQWLYAALPASADPAEGDFHQIAENSILVEGLNELTDYVFYLRAACAEEYNKTLSIAFTTDAHIESVPFAEDFEGASAWKLINGSEANAWTIGNATSFAGDKALYISDNAAAYQYETEAQATVFASILLNFAEDTTYIFEYEWKCEGEFNDEDGALDFLRVALVPGDEELVAGAAVNYSVSLPANWIALDGGVALHGENQWQHISQEQALLAGQYKLVFVWHNDDADSDGVPAAIDNIGITIKPGDTTGFGNIGTDTKAVKFIRGNHVYILVNGVIYDATGRRVE